MRQKGRKAKKQPQTLCTNSDSLPKPELLNLDQILIGQGILTQASDRQAIALALGLADRRPYDFHSN
jgi:hypothetical protein